MGLKPTAAHISPSAVATAPSVSNPSRSHAVMYRCVSCAEKASDWITAATSFIAGGTTCNLL
jgi:hypothetical protein